MAEEAPVEGQKKKDKQGLNVAPVLGLDEKFSGDLAYVWKQKRGSPQKYWIIKMEGKYFNQPWFSDLEKNLDSLHKSGMIGFAAIEDKLTAETKQAYAEVSICLNKKKRCWELCQDLHLPDTLHIRPPVFANAKKCYDSIVLKKGEERRVKDSTTIKIGVFPEKSRGKRLNAMDVAKVLLAEGQTPRYVIQALPELGDKKKVLNQIYADNINSGTVRVQYTLDHFVPVKDWGDRVEWEPATDENGNWIKNPDGTFKPFDITPFLDEDGFIKLDELKKLGRKCTLTLVGKSSLGKTKILEAMLNKLGPIFKIKFFNDARNFDSGYHKSIIADEFTIHQPRCPVTPLMIKALVDPDSKSIDIKGDGLNPPPETTVAITSNSPDPFGYLGHPPMDKSDRVAIESRTIIVRVNKSLWKKPLPPVKALPNSTYRPWGAVIEEETQMEEEVNVPHVASSSRRSQATLPPYPSVTNKKKKKTQEDQQEDHEDTTRDLKRRKLEQVNKVLMGTSAHNGDADQQQDGQQDEPIQGSIDVTC